MKVFVRFLADIVRKSPWLVIAATLVVTAVLFVFMTQQEQASGNEGFSPDTPEFLAQDVIADHFSDNSEEPVQVVVTARDGDLLTADGLRDYLLIRGAIESSDAAQLMKGRPGGDIVGYFDALLIGLEMRAQEMGLPLETLLANLTDADVKQGLLQSLEQTPAEFRDLTLGLYGESSDMTVPKAETAIMVVFLNVADLDDPDLTLLQAMEVDMADRITAAPTVASDGTAFSFALLFSDADQFQSEIGRLFGTAFLIIVAILIFVFWMSRHPSRRYGWTGTWMQSLRLGGLVGAIAAAVVLAVLGLAAVFTSVEPELLLYVPAAAFAALALFATTWARFPRWRRSSADMGLTMLVIFFSIVWMNGAGVILGPKYLDVVGDFNEMLQILPILLIGLGVDYAIHMTSRYREELGAGAEIGESAARATKTVGIALVLATATTSVGFLTNVVNPVTALRDFGILAAIGISSAFILMLTVVPSIRILLDRRGEAAGHLERDAFGHQSERVLPKLMGRSAVLAEKYAVTTLIAALILGVAGFIGLTQLSTTFSFTDFLPEGNELLQTFDKITDEFGGGFGEETEVIIEGDVATPEVHNALAAAWANMGDTDNVLQFGARAAAESPLSIIGQLALSPDQGGNPEVFDAEFAVAAAAAGLQPDLTVASGTDVAALYDLAAASNPDGMARTVAKVDGAYKFMDVGVSTQAGEAAASQLSKDLKEDFEPVVAAGVTAIPTNQNIISTGVVDALSANQATSLAFTILAAMALLVITFWVEVRRPFLGVITILPVVLIVLWVFGVMAARGISFNPVTAMIANVAIGIGVPYTIHITHRYEEDRQRYDNPEEAIRSTTTHTGGALAGSAFTTAAGFGILMTSTLKPFKQLGEVTFWAIIFALVASVLVLPSMLVLWDRWHRKRGSDIVDREAYERAHAGL